MKLKALPVTFLALISILTCATPGACKIVYVNAAQAVDTGDGLTWDTAKQKVASGLSVAVSDDEVWVANGTYVERITLRGGVALYGGFSGTETLREERNWMANVAILDGNGMGSVVTSPTGAAGKTRIDGFTIRNGYRSVGGGIYCSSSSPTIENNIITANVSTSNGGGVYCVLSSAVIVNNRIVGNTAASCGGGLYSGSSLLQAAGNAILANTAVSGGGVYCAGQSPALTNNTLVGNFARTGGGICLAASSAAISNSIVAFNSSGISRTGGSPVLRCNDVFGNATCDYSGLVAGVGDISTDPLLANRDFLDVHLRLGSPCIGCGWNGASALPELDADGQARVQGETVDIGADESDGTDPPTSPPIIVRVSPTGDDSHDGSTWASPMHTVQAAIDAISALGGEVWVKAGTYSGGISLRPLVYIYGGFAGDETAKEQRDWVSNTSVLDADGSGSVVTAAGIGGWGCSCVDGFTIRNATGTGGVLCQSSSLRISNNIITGNSSANGGGICCTASSPVISANRIEGNNVTGTGGGISCRISSSPQIVANTISENHADGAGGGIYCDSTSTPLVVKNTIAKNASHGDGGGVCALSSLQIVSNRIMLNCASVDPANPVACRGGGVWVSSGATISGNCILANYASSGGGVFCDAGTPVITNNTVVANGAGTGGGIHVDCSCASPPISNNIVAYNSDGIRTGGAILCRNNVFGNGEFDYSVSPPSGNISVDPRFVSKEYGDYHLGPGSPCVNAGWNGAMGLQALDIDGQARTQDGAVDIGADEWDGSDPPPGPYRIVRVGPDGNDSNDGSSWLLAKHTVQAGIDAVAASGGDVWVKAGTYDGSIALRANSFVYGGFAGYETGRTQRDWVLNRSVLQGTRQKPVVLAERHQCGFMFCGIDGFTISNGAPAMGSFNYSRAGGIYCDVASPTIANNTITQNDGYAIDTFRSNAEVANNSVSSYGDGLRIGIYSDPVIHNNTISVSGNAVCSYHGCPVIANNTIVNSYYGVKCEVDSFMLPYEATTPTLLNNIIAHNKYGVSNDQATVTLRNNNLYGNAMGEYIGVSPGEGDISADPLLTNRSGGDYHLSATSPCIDKGWNQAAGLPSFDFDYQPRICGDAVDIGADEYWLVDSISGAKGAWAGTPVSPSGSVVTASFPDYLYIESPDRVSGIRVDKTAHGLPVGATADVSGSVQTNVDGERYIAASTVTPIGSGVVTPLAMSNSRLGGGAMGLQLGPTGSVGLNNIGLLIRTWGKFTKTSDTTFTIDDGSGLDVRCVVESDVTLDPLWTFVAVTGISSCERVGGELHALVRALEVAPM